MTNMMTTGRRIGTFFAAAISLLLLGCKPSVPRADYMRKIYANRQERIDEETTGAAAAEMRKRFVVGGDTADVWREKKAFFLTPAVPYNRVDFTVKAETAFRKGDT